MSISIGFPPHRSCSADARVANLTLADSSEVSLTFSGTLPPLPDKGYSVCMEEDGATTLVGKLFTTAKVRPAMKGPCVLVVQIYSGF